MLIGAKRRLLLTLTLNRHRGVLTRGWCATAPGIAVFVPILGHLLVGSEGGFQNPVVQETEPTGAVLALFSRPIFVHENHHTSCFRNTFF